MNPSLRHITHTIYALSGDQRRIRPWLGVVVTRAGTVLIDSGNGPSHVEQLQTALATIEAPPVSHILLTHHHWDHVFGCGYLPDATIVAQEKTQYHLNVMASEPWSAEYNLTKAGASRGGHLNAMLMNAAVPEWGSFRALPAHVTFASDHELTVGEYTFTIKHLGGSHEKDSSVVLVQPGNVLFVGDIPYGSVRGDHDPADLLRELQTLQAYNANWIVEGHRRPSSAAQFASRVEEQAQAVERTAAEG